MSFSRQIDQWVTKSERRMDAVFRGASQSLASRVQSNTPVDTGFLVNSFLASDSAMPQLGDQSSGDAVAAIIANIRFGETLYLGFTANYAPFVEFGARGRPPVGMVRLAAESWPEFVDAAVRDAKARVR